MLVSNLTKSAKLRAGERFEFRSTGAQSFRRRESLRSLAWDGREFKRLLATCRADHLASEVRPCRLSDSEIEVHVRSLEDERKYERAAFCALFLGNVKRATKVLLNSNSQLPQINICAAVC